MKRLGVESGWERDLEHLQIRTVRELGVNDAGRLHDGGPGLEPNAPDAVVVELDPAAKDVDELELERMAMPFARLGRRGAGTDHVRADASAGGCRDAEVAVGEEAAQSVVPARIARVADDEAALLRRVAWV